MPARNAIRTWGGRRKRQAVRLARRRIGTTLKTLDGHAPAAVRRVARDLARNLAGDRVGRALVTIVVTATDDDLEHLDEALRSAIDQSHESLEILLLPYGSAERLPDAVKGWLGADHRIRFVHSAHPTLAAARDHGARLAKGRFFCFLRGHDTLPKQAVSKAFTALHESRSDFAVGRMTAPPSLLPSVLPRRDVVHDGERLHTSLSEFPAVITDMSLGNRMFSVDFWRSARLSFGAVEGETQLVLQCYEAARAFDVITAATYTERTRGGAMPVEQLFDSTADLPSWLTDARAVGQRLRRMGDRLYQHWLVGVFENQLQHFLGDTERMSGELWNDLREAVIELRQGLDDQAWQAVRAESRVKISLLLADRREQLEEFVAARWFERDNVPTMIESGRIYARLPHFDDPDGGVERSAYELGESETPARINLRAVRSGPADLLEVDLLARIELVDLADQQPVITARLLPGAGQRSDPEPDQHGVQPQPIELPVRVRYDEQANLTVGHRYQDYRPGGCTITIDRATLPVGSWHLETTITVAGISRQTDMITVDRRGTAGLMGSRYLPVHNTTAGTAVSIGQRQGRLLLETKASEPVSLASVSVTGRTVRLRPESSRIEVAAVRAHCGGVKVEAPLIDGVAELQLPQPPADAPPTWLLRAVGVGRNAFPLVWQADEPWLSFDGGDVIAARTEWGNAQLAEASTAVLVDRVEAGTGVVRVFGRWMGTPSEGWELAVHGPRHRSRHALTAGPDGGFCCEIPLYHDPWGLGPVGIPRGEYSFSLADPAVPESTPGGPILRPVAGPDFIASLAEFQCTDEIRLRPLCRRNGVIGFSLSQAVPVQDSGSYAQQRLQENCLQGMGPIDPTLVYFSSYDGAQPTDSGLAIQQAMHKLRPELRAVWGVSDLRTPVPESSTAVLINSREWYQVISTAGYLVQNVDFPRWWRKRPGQQFLQTFHGYPAKAMGLMMWRAKEFTPRRLQAELDRTMAGWDLILTPAPEMDQYYRREYAYQGPIHHHGYPRDDDLVLPEAEQRRQLVRRLLGITPDQKAILYAPTWRDHLASSYQSASMVDNLDVASAAAELGDDYVLLLRGHRFTSRNRRDDGPGTTKIIDVTEYPEINDLIVASDAAVLDYSSLRFDFALTGRPMVFLVPDLADYTGGVRGFLFDYTDSAPGPLVETADEVINALRDLDGLAADYRDAIKKFNDRYQYLQDGHCAERVVRRFFGDQQRSDD